MTRNGLAMFPAWDLEDWQQVVRKLCYKVHGGSGYNFTRRDVLEMPLGEVAEAADWLDTQRRRESEAIERAAKKPSKG